MSQIQLSGIRAVIFDLDDTLYPEREFAYSGFRAVSEWLKQKIACRTDPEATMRKLFDGPHRGRVFDQLLLELGCERSAELIPPMIECFRQHTPVITLYPDALAAIDRWRGCFQMGVLSDGFLAVQERKIQALGLGSRLHLIVLTDRWGREFWKPHPHGFQYIEKSCQVSGPACLYIADNPRKDFIAPIQLGWRTVRVHRLEGIYCQEQPAKSGIAEFEVSTLDDIDLSS